MAAPTTYSRRLQAAIDRAGLAKRQVAKMLADLTGHSTDDERSSLYRYLKGQQPSPERAQLLAEVLSDPSLAEVQPRQRRQLADRLAALEAEVAAMQAERDLAVQAVVGRLADLEAAQARLEQQSDQQSTRKRP